MENDWGPDLLANFVSRLEDLNLEDDQDLLCLCHIN